VLKSLLFKYFLATLTGMVCVTVGHEHSQNLYSSLHIIRYGKNKKNRIMDFEMFTHPSSKTSCQDDRTSGIFVPHWLLSPALQLLMQVNHSRR